MTKAEQLLTSLDIPITATNLRIVTAFRSKAWHEGWYEGVDTGMHGSEERPRITYPLGKDERALYKELLKKIRSRKVYVSR